MDVVFFFAGQKYRMKPVTAKGLTFGGEMYLSNRGWKWEVYVEDRPLHRKGLARSASEACAQAESAIKEAIADHAAQFARRGVAPGEQDDAS